MAFINIVTGHTGVDHVTSDDDRHFNAAVVGNGDFILEGGNGWEPTIIGANSVRVASGEASVQGCHIRSSEPVEITLEVGVSGYKRNDLIGILYKNTNGIESAELTSVRGTATTGTPVDPTYTADDILNGGEERFAPLIRAVFNGTAIQSVTVIAKDTTAINDLVEYGENNNGNYYKFANGLLICSLAKIFTDQLINTPYGAGYIGTREWVFPHPFADNPVVSCGSFRYGTSASWGGCGNPSLTSVMLTGYDFYPQGAIGTNVYIKASAIGRWK